MACGVGARLDYCRGIIVLAGSDVDRAGAAGQATVPDTWRRNRQERDGDSFHVTVLSKPDLQQLADGIRDSSLRWPEGAVPPVAEDPASIAKAVAVLIASMPGALLWMDLGGGRPI